jgi:hypothetical protein
MSHVSVDYSVASESGHSLRMQPQIPTLQLMRERNITVQRSLNVPYSDQGTPRSRFNRNPQVFLRNICENNIFQYWNQDYLNRPSEPKLAKRYKNYFKVPKLKPIYPNKTPVPPRESTLNFLKRLNL